MIRYVTVTRAGCLFFFFLIIRRPPRSTRTDTLFPYTTLFRSDPTLGVSIESFPISGPLAFEPQRDDFTMVRVGVSQDIPNLAKRHAQQARADSDIKAAEADTAVEVRTVEVGTALAWIGRAYARGRAAHRDDVTAAEGRDR